MAIDKYRFSDPLLFGTDDNGMVYPYLDTDVNPTHDFKNEFFSYEKSKMLIAWFRVPVNFVIST